MSGLPITLKEFGKNPVSAIALLSLCATLYLYLDLRTQMELQIETLQEEVRALKADNKELQRQYIELAKSIK
jgi:hypothetical protein